MRRGLWLPLAVLLALLLLGGTVTLAMKAAQLYAATATGTPNLDRFRLSVAWAVARQFGADASPELARAVMAIIRNESQGRPAPVIGDAALGGGPSVGPMQVYRSTAKDLGLWAPPPDAQDDASERDAYASVANDEATGIRWGVAVFAAKLEAAGGDVADALRRYNGGGAAAAAYRDRAISWLDAQGWGLS